MKIYELGHVVLYVTNVARSAHFYNKILGFPLLAQQPGMAVFSSGRTHHELLLIEIGGKPRKRTIEPGLYHIGFKIGSTEAELKKAYRELVEHNIPIVGATDHTITHSLYILDPDGNELELYIDVSQEWKKNPHLILTAPKKLRLE